MFITSENAEKRYIKSPYKTYSLYELIKVIFDCISFPASLIVSAIPAVFHHKRLIDSSVVTKNIVTKFLKLFFGIEVKRKFK